MTAERRPETTALQLLDTELVKRTTILQASAAMSIDPERFRNVVLAMFSRTPSLFDCDPVSIARACVEAAQLGLEPTGLLGGAYLVPFKNTRSGKREAQLIVGYRGLVELVRRSGELLKVEARVVREQDAFEYEYGLDQRLSHIPALVPDPGRLTYVYAIAFLRSGERQFDVMSAAEVDVIARRSKSKDQQGNPTGPWVTDYFEMAKKTVLRRMSKLLPLSIEAKKALELEEEYEQDQRDPRPVRVSTLTPLRNRLQARLGATETVIEPETEQTTETAEEETSAAACGNVAGPGVAEGEVCINSDPNHTGMHKSETASWPR